MRFCACAQTDKNKTSDIALSASDMVMLTRDYMRAQQADAAEIPKCGTDSRERRFHAAFTASASFKLRPAIGRISAAAAGELILVGFMSLVGVMSVLR